MAISFVVALVGAGFLPWLSAGRSSGFVVRQGIQLQRDGKPFRFIGMNIYNANSRDWNGGCGGSVDMDLAAESLHGLPVVRAWFSQWLATDAQGRRDWSAFDATLAAARRHGVLVIATLGDQWGDCEGFANRASGYKGLAWYQSGYRTQVQAPHLALSYRDWVGQVTSRYSTDRSILMWQMMNEAEAADSLNGPCSPRATAAIRSFATDIGDVIRSSDPNHLINLGTIGSGQCGLSGDEYRQVNAIPQIDVLEYHDYSRPGQPDDPWNGLSVRRRQAKQLDKPLFVGEVGAQVGAGGLAGRSAQLLRTVGAEFSQAVIGAVVWTWSDPTHGGRDGYAIRPGDPLLPQLINVQHRLDAGLAVASNPR